MKNKTVENAQDLIRAIDGLTASITQHSEARTFFAKSLKDLAGLKARLENCDMRIAVIGITSSGKSTLMNAVLGAPLLPTRVGPSSSKQVLCGWDTEQKAEIIFDPATGKAPRTVKGSADRIRGELEKYGDEKFNPGNREQVDEIRVHAPGFKFNRDLVIIDTPGLDAYGLDQHKEVTMKLVLPTVDMVLFLTNVKCDSDAANLGFIDSVTTDSKPLVVVQNKIDSIEEKISRQGVVKTFEEIKRDHRQRVMRLLENARKASVRNAPVVQVSARASWKESNLAELGRVLDEQVRMNSGNRVARRMTQFQQIVKEMAAALAIKRQEVSAAGQARRDEEARLDDLAKVMGELKSSVTRVDLEICKTLKAVTNARDALLKQIDDEHSSTLDQVKGFFGVGRKKYREASDISFEIKSLQQKFETRMREANACLSRSISSIQDKTRQCAAAVGFEESQLVRTTPFRSRTVLVRSEQRSREVERTIDHGRGFLFWRSLTGNRYETICETEYYYDIHELVDNIEQAYTSFAEPFDDARDSFAERNAFVVQKFDEELNDRRAALAAQARLTLPMEVVQSLTDRLDDCQGYTIASAMGEVRNATARDSGVPAAKSLAEVDVPASVLEVARLAHVLSFDIPCRYVNGLIARSGKRRIVICGWDAVRIQAFREWFFRADAQVEVADFGAASRVPDPSADALVFLLVNAEQAGSFKGKILGDGPGAKYVAQAALLGKIVWVMDSVREHVSSVAEDGALMDAFTEMALLVRGVMKAREPFDVMACDRDLYWTLLLRELYFKPEITQSEGVRQRFVAGLADLFGLSPERRHATGRYVTQFNASGIFQTR